MSVNHVLLWAAFFVALIYVLRLALTLKDEDIEPVDYPDPVEEEVEYPEAPKKAPEAASEPTPEAEAPEAPQNAPETVFSPEPVIAPVEEVKAPEVPQKAPEAIPAPDLKAPFAARRGVVSKKKAAKKAAKKAPRKKNRKNPDRG
jgi:hypothetical protein